MDAIASRNHNRSCYAAARPVGGITLRSDRRGKAARFQGAPSHHPALRGRPKPRLPGVVDLPKMIYLTAGPADGSTAPIPFRLRSPAKSRLSGFPACPETLSIRHHARRRLVPWALS
jgi:hypothetical protein